MPEVGNISARVSLDTAEFRQGIKQMSQQMQIAREEFKQATSWLDRVGDAMEIAKAKAKMLEQQIEMQEKTVEQLNEQYEKAKEQYGENSRQATQYRLSLERARTSLTQMRTDLNRTNQEMENLNNNTEEGGNEVTNYSEKLSSLSETAKTAALGLAAIGAVAIGGMITKGVIAADEMEKAINGLQASTGLLNDEETKFGEIMKDMYANNFGANFDDIGKSLATVNQQTGMMGNELKNTTENAMILRDTFEMEVGESIRSTDMMMKTFGDTSKEAYNLIALGAQNGLDKNGNLLDSVNEYSIHFKQIGLDSEDMFNMFTNGAKAGVFDIDKLGDAVKEFGIRSKDGSKGTTEAFTALGLDAQKLTQDFAVGGEKGKAAFELVTSKINAMQDPVKQNQIGVALFGSMWEDMGVKAVAALTSNEKSINKNIDALKNINDVKYNDFGSAITGIGRQFETAIVIPLGEKILPSLNKFASWFKDQIPTIKNFFDKFANFKTIENIIIGATTALLAFTAATKTLIIIETIQKAWATFNVLLAAYRAGTLAATAAQMGLNFAMLANPIGLIIAGIIALIGAIVLIVKNWDWFKTNWLANFQQVLDFTMMVWEGIKTSFSAALDFIIGIVSLWWENTKNNFNTGIEIIKSITTAFVDVIVSMFNFLKDGAINIITTLINGIVSFFTNLYNTASNIITTMVNAIIGSFQWLYDHNYYFKDLVDFIVNIFTTLSDTAKNIWDGITNFLSTSWENIKTTSSTVFSSISEFISNTWNTISNFISGVIGTISGVISTGWNIVKDNVSNSINTTSSLITTVWNGIYNSVSGIIGTIYNYVTNSFNNIKSSISGPLNSAKETVSNIISNISNSLSGLADKAYNWGSNAIGMFIDGIKRKAESVGKAAKNIAEAVAKYLGFHSPTELGPGADADKWMPNFVNMMTSGLESGIPKIKDISEKLGNSLVFKNPMNSLSNINEIGSRTVNNNTPIGNNLSFVDIGKQISSSIGNVLGGNSSIVNVYVTLDGKELTNTISTIQQSNQISNSRRKGVVSFG